MADTSPPPQPLESAVAPMPLGGESVSVGDKKLYMFSDIEGCQTDSENRLCYLFGKVHRWRNPIELESRSLTENIPFEIRKKSGKSSV